MKQGIFSFALLGIVIMAGCQPFRYRSTMLKFSSIDKSISQYLNVKGSYHGYQVFDGDTILYDCGRYILYEDGTIVLASSDEPLFHTSPTGICQIEGDTLYAELYFRDFLPLENSMSRLWFHISSEDNELVLCREEEYGYRKLKWRADNLDHHYKFFPSDSIPMPYTITKATRCLWQEPADYERYKSGIIKAFGEFPSEDRTYKIHYYNNEKQ